MAAGTVKWFDDANVREVWPTPISLAAYRTPSSSTSKVSVAMAGMTPGKPRIP